MKPATIRRTVKVFIMFQNGELEVYQAFRTKCAKQGESFKGAVLRVMRKELG